MNLLDNTNINQTTLIGQHDSSNFLQKSSNFDGKKKGKDLDFKDQDSVQGSYICRICLGEDEEDGQNPMIHPCKCDGTMKFIHLKCLKEWMNSKRLVYNGDRVKSYFWKALECELCKMPFENKLKDELFQIMEFDRP